jgi:hypothetical protein
MKTYKLIVHLPDKDSWKHYFGILGVGHSEEEAMNDAFRKLFKKAEGRFFYFTDINRVPEKERIYVLGDWEQSAADDYLD